MADDQNYSYEVLISNLNVHACAHLLANSFTKSNSVTMSYGITTETHFVEVCLPLTNNVLSEHLSSSLVIEKHEKLSDTLLPATCTLVAVRSSPILIFDGWRTF
jgi:hypothetical protein